MASLTQLITHSAVCRSAPASLVLLNQGLMILYLLHGKSCQDGSDPEKKFSVQCAGQSSPGLMKQMLGPWPGLGLLCSAVQCSAVQCSAVQCSARGRLTKQPSNEDVFPPLGPGYSDTQVTVAWTLHCTVLYSTVLHITVMHLTALHCTALYCITK